MRGVLQGKKFTSFPVLNLTKKLYVRSKLPAARGGDTLLLIFVEATVGEPLFSGFRIFAKVGTTGFHECVGTSSFIGDGIGPLDGGRRVFPRDAGGVAVSG